MREVIAIAGFVCGIFVGAVHAAGVGDANSESTIANQLQQIFVYGDSDSRGVRFVIGNELWLPDEHYEDGDDWLALACT
ncbi:MAG: hypothetical protein R3288_16010, partial [Woeseiaceae bacterium]|nr:hypothetical protein [Woeseiaceae bacterium]